jgi:predicted ATP-dependent protease
MMIIKPLSPKLLCIKCKPKQLNFSTSLDLADLEGPIGQDRALAAIELGIHMPNDGYNLYLLGPEGTGKHYLINLILHEQARQQDSAEDWCYVNNFKNPHQPLCLSLPTGLGPSLQKDMDDLVKKLISSISIELPKERINDAFHVNEKISTIVASAMGPLREKYQDIEEVLSYFQDVEADIIKNPYDFQPTGELNAEPSPLIRFQVNALVSHIPRAGAPVIFEDNPTYPRLMGGIKHSSHSKDNVPEFTLIRAGSLHHANGGYLILNAQQIVNHPEAWEALKRSLLSQKIIPENSERASGLPSKFSMEPQAIPLKIKVILLGERALYYSLCENDFNFSNLFKVAADFSNHINRSDNNLWIFARLVGTIAKKENLLPINRHAIAKMIDHSARLANDQLRLFTNMRFLVDLVHESNYWAVQNQHKVIKAIDVETAIEQKIYRSNRVQMHVREDFSRNLLLVDTKGKKIGQVNGLSVLQIGHYSFGSPSRITATVRLGKGEVIDIEREVELGGALHSKGVLILSGYINGRYLPERHLAFSASLVFEQNYGEVEGDSASAAELAALLSAIAHLPVKQSLAITGSVNQFGQIQAIGNTNDKIEGFYDICRLKGFNGRQGVIIPQGNVQHLMLRDDIVEAARKRNFFVYAVETIDELMSVLTGMPAGKADKNGHFSEETVNGIIEQSLLKYAEHADEEHKSDTQN